MKGRRLRICRRRLVLVSVLLCIHQVEQPLQVVGLVRPHDCALDAPASLSETNLHPLQLAAGHDIVDVVQDDINIFLAVAGIKLPAIVGISVVLQQNLFAVEGKGAGDEPEFECPIVEKLEIQWVQAQRLGQSFQLPGGCTEQLPGLLPENLHSPGVHPLAHSPDFLDLAC